MILADELIAESQKIGTQVQFILSSYVFAVPFQIQVKLVIFQFILEREPRVVEHARVGVLEDVSAIYDKVFCASVL